MTTLEKNAARLDLFTQTEREMRRLMDDAAETAGGPAARRAVLIDPPSWGSFTRRFVAGPSDTVFYVGVFAGFAAGAAVGIAGAPTLAALVAAAVVTAVVSVLVRTAHARLMSRRVVVGDPAALAVWSVLEDALRHTGAARTPLAIAMHTELAHLERIARGDLEYLGRVVNGVEPGPAAAARVTEDLAEIGSLSLAARWSLSKPGATLVEVTPRKGSAAGAKDELIELIASAAG